MQLTKLQLWNYHRELSSYSGSILEVFHRQKIKDFYRHNKIKIESIEKSLMDMQLKYFVYEEGQQKLEDGKPVLVEGLTLQDYTKEFNDELNVLIETNI